MAISSGYELRDFFQDHPEIEVDGEFLNKVCGLPRFTLPVPPISVENPVMVKDVPNWKATAERIQDQLTDVAMNAAATLNAYGSQIPNLQLAFYKEREKTEFYMKLAKKAGDAVETIKQDLARQKKHREIT